MKVMGVLREMAVREGYVSPAFFKNVKDIDRFSQTLRHHMVMSIAPKKQEDFTINPKDLLSQMTEDL